MGDRPNHDPFQKLQIYQKFVKGSCLGRFRILSYAFSTIFSHCAVSARSLTRCPGQVELIHGAWYCLIVENCRKIHSEVAPSFPAGVSQVCNVFLKITMILMKVCFVGQKNYKKQCAFCVEKCNFLGANFENICRKLISLLVSISFII